MKKILFVLLCCVSALYVSAAPARREGRMVKQADGTELMVFSHGDEYFHWQTDQDGRWIELAQDGMYQEVAAMSEQEIAARRSASPRFRKPTQTTQATPTNIAPRGLIILVNFADTSFITPKSEIDSMINGAHYTRQYSYTYTSYFKKYTVNVASEGSARQYFHDVSAGQYNPQFDVVGPVKISKSYSYYGKNDRWGNDQKPEEMVKEACQLAYSECGVDYSLYDNDNDGTVDFVYIYYAGAGESDGGAANTVWPHSSSLTELGTSLSVGGKKIDKYACSNEMSSLSGYHDGIGTFCHEFTHVLGLPDLYRTDGSSGRTLGDWDILDYGCYNNDGNTPCAFSGYERFFCGWVTPQVLTDSAYYSLNELNSSNTVLLISPSGTHNLVGNDPNPTTFYLLENRQQKGWDEHLVGHGLMLTKIQYSYTTWYNNTVNNSTNSMGVDIIEATTNTSTGNRASDLFPAGGNAYTGISGYALTDIKEENGVVYFSLSGGKTPRETSIDHTDADDEQIIGIYTLTGQSLPIDTPLEHGVYIIRTNKKSYKIAR